MRFTPEPLDMLKARLAKALEAVHDPQQIVEGRQKGQGAEHTFDFERGVRLMVSRDRIGDATYLHVSASWHPMPPQSMQEALSAVQASLWELGFPYEVMPVWHDITPAGIPHWFFDNAGQPPRCLRKDLKPAGSRA